MASMRIDLPDPFSPRKNTSGNESQASPACELQVQRTDKQTSRLPFPARDQPTEAASFAHSIGSASVRLSPILAHGIAAHLDAVRLKRSLPNQHGTLWVSIVIILLMHKQLGGRFRSRLPANARCSVPAVMPMRTRTLGGGATLRSLNDRKGQELIDGVLDLVDRMRPLHLSLVGGDPLVRYRELES
jgi:hypothetical protein